MIKAYLMYTGEDGDSHFTAGSIADGALVKADHVLFKESPAHSTFDWHNDPIPQYVITLSGILEFTMKNGESFILHPGDVLLATDETGTGHQWKLLNDAPWKRIYAVFEAGADTHFIPDSV